MYKIYVDGNLFVSSKIEDLAIINPVIDKEVNKAGTFSFTLPPTHPGYNTIQKRTSLISVYRDDESQPIFEGVAIDSTTDFYKQKKITCEGALTFFNDSMLRPQKYSGLTPRQLLQSFVNQHNAAVESNKRFTVGQVTLSDSNTITCFSNYESTLSAIKTNLIDVFGGFLRIRYDSGIRYIDYLQESPRTNNQLIRLGQNLLDLSMGLDTEEIATVIIPLGQTLETQSIEGLDERLTIESAAADSYHPSGTDYVYSQSAVSTYGWIEKVVEWDEITTAAELLSKGEAYLTQIQFENLIITAKAIDLGLTSDEFNQFRILDQIRVLSAPHGLDRYFVLSKQKINLNDPEKDTVTLGIEELNTLSAKTQNTNENILKKIEQLPTSNMVQSAIDNATALITGAEGGYIVITRNSDGQPTEIKIQDALENPTKIWRWNVNGLGYSSDGGATYGLAMTMNGAIVADYITSGTMYADRIKGGTLTLGGASNTNGQLIVKDASSNIVGQWNKDGIKLYSGTVGGWYIKDDRIVSYNGTSESTSTKRVVLWKYFDGSDPGAFEVATRNSTSDAWAGNFIITYNGNIVSQSAVNVYPTDSTYGMHIHGKIYSNGDISCEGAIYTNWDILSDQWVKGSGGVAGGAMNCYGNMYVSGSLAVVGNKSRAVATDNFGYKTLSAYETPTPYFGDIGEGVLDSNGECIVFIDEILAECIDSDCKYQVFLQKYGEGDLWIAERNTDYFIVKGTANLSFGWELKAIQRDFNGVRFAELDQNTVDYINQGKEENYG